MYLPNNNLKAELVGIALGDGNIGRYKRCQYLRIYCNPRQEQYIGEVSKILNKLFNKNPYRYFRKDAGVVYLEISKKNINRILKLPVGDKIRNKAIFPDWIWRKKGFVKSCLRGLFDTDGGIYLTGGKYKIVDFSSHNPYLLDNIYKGLKMIGFNPYIRQSSIELGRIQEVERFFEKVKPRNQRHYRFNLPR